MSLPSLSVSSSLSLSLSLSLSHRAHLTHNIGSASALSIKKGEIGGVKVEKKSANLWQGKVYTHSQVRFFCKGKCTLIAKCEFLARESVNSSPILARQWWRHFRLSLSLYLSLSPSAPHAQYRKRFRASYNKTEAAGVEVTMVMFMFERHVHKQNLTREFFFTTPLRVGLLRLWATQFRYSSRKKGTQPCTQGIPPGRKARSRVLKVSLPEERHAAVYSRYPSRKKGMQRCTQGIPPGRKACSRVLKVSLPEERHAAVYSRYPSRKKGTQPCTQGIPPGRKACSRALKVSLPEERHAAVYSRYPSRKKGTQPRTQGIPPGGKACSRALKVSLPEERHAAVHSRYHSRKKGMQPCTQSLCMPSYCEIVRFCYKRARWYSLHEYEPNFKAVSFRLGQEAFLTSFHSQALIVPPHSPLPAPPPPSSPPPPPPSDIEYCLGWGGTLIDIDFLKWRQIFSMTRPEWVAFFNPFTATRCTYTSQKRPCRWPRTYIYVQPQFRFYAFVKARPPMWSLLHVSEVSSSSVRWSLLALLGLVQLRKQFFYASRGFCPNGGKQRGGCSQMRHKLAMVRAVRLMAFVTTAIEETACFVLLKVRVTGMTVEVGWERKIGERGAWWKKKMTTLLAAVNEDLDVQTHSERFSSSRDRRYECTSIVASEIASQLSGELQSRSAASKRW